MELFGWHTDYWQWWVLGLVLLILEVFTPGFIFIWMGISAGVVGWVLLLYPDLGWQYQVLLFSLLSIVAIVGWRLWLFRHPIRTDQPTLNRRAAQYIGRSFTLDAPIVNGRGRIRVDDSYWRVEGPDLPIGSRVQVVAVDGVVLKIHRAETATHSEEKGGREAV